MYYIFSLIVLLIAVTVMFVLFFSTEKELRICERKLAELQQRLDKERGKNE